jgi:hypothetical protein
MSPSLLETIADLWARMERRARRARPPRTAMAWVAPPLAAALVLAAVYYSNLRDRPRAYAAAHAELRNRLEPGERVWREVDALQRHWYDLYRATYGVLAATDRRIIFVGAVPELYASSDDPRPFEVRAFPYDSAFAMYPGASAPLAATRMVVVSGDSAGRFVIARHQREALQALTALATQRALALTEVARREQWFRDSVLALGPVREYYAVRPGDALSTIARRFETTPDQIRTLNALVGDRIRVGESLVVRQTPRPVPPCPAALCGITSANAGEIQPESARTTSPTPRSADRATRPRAPSATPR